MEHMVILEDKFLKKIEEIKEKVLVKLMIH